MIHSTEGDDGGGSPASHTVAAAPTHGLHIALGGEHSCVLEDADHVLCWGSNEDGQLGIGSAIKHVTKPTLVPGLHTVVQIAGGEFFTCALLETGRVECWGRNYCGQIGVSGSGNVYQPTVVPGVDGAVEIATGYESVCARHADGTLDCWGCSGEGTNPDSLAAITAADGVALGTGFGCAWFNDGSLSCWGDNKFGNLGDGTTTSRNQPMAVPSISDVTSAGLGSWDACALHHDGTLDCWGSNSSGQMGSGTGTTGQAQEYDSPSPVPGLSGVTEVALGWLHTCALLSDGTVQCWGADYTGQLGDGDKYGRAKDHPTPVVGLSGVREIALGLDHSCAWRASNDVECWGQNDKGQLGDGTTQWRSVAEPVVW